MRQIPALALLSLCPVMPYAASADDLTRTIQKDLVALGYDPGNIQGEATTQTAVAISTFQAEHGLEVTGEVSPQLAGDIARTSGDIYAANATAEDIQAAAEDLGLTEEEVEACRNAQ